MSKCQLCYCVNKNKLICNVNNSRDKVKLGSYKLYDCGENLINNLLKIVHSDEMLLRSVTKKPHIKNKNTAMRTKTEIITENTSIPMVILLNSEESVDSFKSKEDKAAINMNIEIAYENFYDKDSAPIDTVPKRKLFLKNFGDGDDGINIDTVEYNGDLDQESKLIQNHVDTDSDVSKEVNINDLSGVDLPKILENILSLSMRKSMVSVSSGKECKPGTSVKDGCNTCFCLTNGKTLCTNRNCE